MSTNFVPGTLRERITHISRQALASGALHSLPTTYEFVEQKGVRFVVRRLAVLERKAEARRQQAEKKTLQGVDFDPFLPYEEDLYVTDLGEKHVCLLNKFNVFDHHLLIVTRAFEEQEALLNLEDFAALARCMVEFEGLAFYNGGSIAGASQRHKHLQYVPLPLSSEGPAIPTAPLIQEALEPGKATKVALPFLCVVAPLSTTFVEPLSTIAEQLHATYLSLFESLRLRTTSLHQPVPYNLLATRNWMMLVPRSQEHYETISVNALGFAGSLFVRNQADMDFLRAAGPMRVLQEVGVVPGVK
ncbi:MAG: DUF4922 domain-containing protein [Caldilineaceae bacterium]